MASIQADLNNYFDHMTQPAEFAYANILRNTRTIATQSVISTHGESEVSSLMGRAICVIHVAATPLKALAGIGLLALRVIQIASITLGILTLNRPPQYIKHIGHAIIDIAVGGILLPVALLANVIRGVTGAIFHPGVLIRDVQHINHNTFAAAHNAIQGTLVYYPV